MRFLTSTRMALVVVLAALAFAPASRIQAQGTDLGTIRGNVIDASGAAVPKANVTITDTETGIRRVVKITVSLPRRCILSAGFFWLS